MNQVKQYGLDTKSLIITAYMKNLKVTSAEKVTVKQIIHTAGISRSTFYLHFQSKFDVIKYITKETLNEFSIIFLSKIENKKYEQQEYDELLFRLSMKMVQHLYDHLYFYKEQLNDLQFGLKISSAIEKNLYGVINNEDLSCFIANGIIGNLKNWILTDEIKEDSIEDLALKLKSFAIYSLQLLELHSDCE